ncbi:MAG: hypothetical protein J6X80_05320 [Lachnospiraceae bacterium]|nr:hypothetical protein [Lachnospiraceae bacterium]
MKREEVQNLLNDLEEWRETPFGYDHEVVYDNNDEFQICYDDDDEDEVARIESVQVAVKNYW